MTTIKPVNDTSELDSRSDYSLLLEVASKGSSSCFSELVRRHAGMVLSACRRMSFNSSDADDAAQAVFLILWKKASTISERTSIADWLHRVARNVCRNANRARQIRQQRERRAAEMKSDSVRDHWEDIREVLDDEVSRLPENLRLPIILFHFEGRSLEDIAGMLGSNVSTIGTRLSRARERLRLRLVRHGINVGATAFVAALTNQAGAADAPASFISSTTQVASSFTAANATITEMSASSLELANNWEFIMNVKKAQAAGALTLAALGLIVGGIVLAQIATNTPQKMQGDLAELQGTWTVVSYEKDGQTQPDSQFLDYNMRLTFEGSALGNFMTAPNGQEIGEKDITFVLDPTTSPKTMKASQRGQSLLGIYELDKDLLKLCIDRTGNRPTSFKAGPDQLSYVAKRSQNN